TSSFRINVNSRSNGPSKASRSSSSSRTIIAETLVAGADAALRHGHGGPLRHDPARARPLDTGLRPDELPPDEERRRQHEQDDRDVRVQAQAEVRVRGIDSQQLLEEAPEGVDGDVEREQRGPADAEVAVDEQQDPHAA